MLYLLTGHDPTPLARAPFKADQLFGERLTLLNRPAYLPPCLHAFVGADIVCAALASGMLSQTKPSLLCDIGTNGELALWKNGRLYVTSTAAGPAFEGAGISCGCSSISGAIDSVCWESGTLRVHTIGDDAPVGLCGSGLIDAVAAMLDAGAVDETGMMDSPFPLTEGISLTQADIRAVQLCKGAIAAGIRCLADAACCPVSEIESVYLAGGFGSRINVHHAARIGLLPVILADRTKAIGNAALDGAAMLLLDSAHLSRLAEIRDKSIHVVLGGDRRFNQRYMDALLLEPAN